MMDSAGVVLEQLQSALREVDERKLLDGLRARVVRDRETTAEMLAYLGEIDRRELWKPLGHASLFAFCTDRFGMSESCAGKRVWAARMARRFPALLEMIARGEIHLTAIMMLGKHLTEENHREVLARARNMRQREVEHLVAEIAPKPDAPTVVAALPAPRKGEHTVVVQTRSEEGTSESSAPSLMFDERPRTSATTPPATAPLPASAIPAGRVTPLAPRRYRVQVTVGQEAHDALRELADLMSHQVPNGDPAVIVERALLELLDRSRAKRAAATKKPRSQKTAPSTKRTRHVPAAIERQVRERDRNRCAFVGADGHRCNETKFLELHHKHGFARGGAHTEDNLELRCRTHNQYEADRDYGKVFMDAKRNAPDRVREASPPYRRDFGQCLRIPHGTLRLVAAATAAW